MRLVVDASVAVKWLIAEDGSDAAALLLMDGDDLHAPRLMASEVANALWCKIRKGEVERGQVDVLTAAVCPFVGARTRRCAWTLFVWPSRSTDRFTTACT